MKAIKPIVLLGVFAAAGSIISGCDRSESASAQVKQASPQKDAKASSNPTEASPKQAEAPAAPSFASTEKAVERAVTEKSALQPTAVDVKPAVKPTVAEGANVEGQVITREMARPDPSGHGAKPVVDPALFIVKAEQSEVDLGEIPTNDSKRGTVTLINTGDTPATVTAAKAGCGCTTLKFSPNTVIPAKEKLAVDVQLSGGTRPGPIHSKTVTFTVEGQPDVIVKLKAQAISFVTFEPAELDPAGDGKVKLKSIDGQAFRVMSATPAALAELDKESKVEHELTFSWEKFREIGVARQAQVYLDHPKCSWVAIPMKFSQEEIAKEQLRKRQLQREKLGQELLDPNPKKGDPLLKAEPVAPTPEVEVANLIKAGNNEEVIKRLDTGLDVNLKDSTGLTLLGQAAKHGNVELIKALVATKKADLETADKQGRTPLMHAATTRNAQAVRVLLDAGASTATKDAIGSTALSWAAMRGDAASVQELVDAGSDVEAVGLMTGWTPLIWAAAVGDVESIEPLVKANANLEAPDHLEGATPLIRAATMGKPEAIKVLIKLGANIENVDRNGNTAFLAAAGQSGGDVDKVKALVDAGANIRAKDNRGFNALQLARKRTDPRGTAVVALLEPLLGAETPAADDSKTPAPAGN